MQSLKSNTGLALFSASLIVLSFFFAGCPCEDWVKLGVFTGSRSPEECRKLLEQHGDPDTPTFLCPGEQVTICWASNKDINLDPGFGHQSTIGIQFLTVKADTTVKATPISSCAGTKEAQVKVVSQDTPSTWTGGWDTQCSFISFEVDEVFVSKNIKAKDITALWAPGLVDRTSGQTIACTVPPFLEGFHVEEIFGFPIAQPFQTEAFSRKLRAVGHWRFAWKAKCPTLDGHFMCDPTFRGPFDLTLTCAE